MGNGFSFFPSKRHIAAQLPDRPARLRTVNHIALCHGLIFQPNLASAADTHLLQTPQGSLRQDKMLWHTSGRRSHNEFPQTDLLALITHHSVLSTQYSSLVTRHCFTGLP